MLSKIEIIEILNKNDILKTAEQNDLLSRFEDDIAFIEDLSAVFVKHEKCLKSNKEPNSFEVCWLYKNSIHLDIDNGKNLNITFLSLNDTKGYKEGAGIND